MLPRTLELEFSEDLEETSLYDQMDHQAVNEAFVTDLVAGGSVGPDVLDIGTGTARIPILLCQQLEDVRVMALDASTAMLDCAQTNVDVATLLHRIQLAHENVHDLAVFEDDMFDTVLSNTLLHHLPDPMVLLSESVRMTKPGGRVFVRDLVRPASESAVEAIVQDVSAGEPESAQQLLRQSLHAALTLDEVQAMVAQLGLDPETVQMTSDRHWTLDAVIAVT